MVAGKIRMMNSWHWYAYQVTVNMMKFICFDDQNLIQPDVGLTSIQLRRIPRCKGLGVSRDMAVSKKWLTCRLRPSEILLVLSIRFGEIDSEWLEAINLLILRGFAYSCWKPDGGSWCVCWCDMWSLGPITSLHTTNWRSLCLLVTRSPDIGIIFLFYIFPHVLEWK